MTRMTEQAREIAYPQLSKDHIDAVIASLVFTLREHQLGASTGTYESALSYLIGFRTRRWGLPPAIAGVHREVSGAPTRA